MNNLPKRRWLFTSLHIIHQKN